MWFGAHSARRNASCGFVVWWGDRFLQQLRSPLFVADSPGSARARLPRYVMWDGIFDLRDRQGFAVSPIVTPSTPLPELRFLRLPFRF